MNSLNSCIDFMKLSTVFTHILKYPKCVFTLFGHINIVFYQRNLVFESYLFGKNPNCYVFFMNTLFFSPGVYKNKTTYIIL